MDSYLHRAKIAAMDLMTSDADKIQLNKSQCTYLCEIINKAFELNDRATALSPQKDSESHREENSHDTNHPSPDNQLAIVPGNPGKENPETHDNPDSAEWRELCFAIEHAQVLVRRCCNENVLEAAILQTDLTEEILTLVSFFSKGDIVDCKTKLEGEYKGDEEALKKRLEEKKQELKEQEQGVLAAYLLERLYNITPHHGERRPTRSNKW